ncbi:hypothetical protein D4T97_011040 [Siminovitchia acidinfaciens]|uniref:Bacterial Ig domain-containing protein n=1 Tax=Siminovitchia acidinfaciens TaxID=2321395 RepID=A0A429XZI2_9BACI|nr:Ig-like domain-containing protein [Siminovitchia acidinfaciens]RST74205.1 hypothetical protein D4T97_011040 [Siminovitchia acidinfaciens]
MDPSGNKSDSATVKVLDKTPPAVPIVYKVSTGDLKVRGKTEAGAKVVVKAGEKLIGSRTADKYGKYTVAMKTRRKAGTVIYVTAMDKAGNVSKARKVTVR